MTAQTWPGGVSAKPLLDSYQEKLKSFNSEFEPDVGPPSRWPRSASAMLEASWRVFLSAADREALMTFYVTTCKSGSLPVTLDDPISGTSYTWFWIEPPGFDVAGFGTHCTAEIKLRRFVS